MLISPIPLISSLARRKEAISIKTEEYFIWPPLWKRSMTPSLDIEPGPHWWEASARIAAPSVITREFKGSFTQSDFIARQELR